MTLHRGQPHVPFSHSTSLPSNCRRPLTLCAFTFLFLALSFTLFPTAINAQGTPSEPVPSTFFGMIFNNANDAWPLNKPISYGLVRVWDSGAQWPTLQIAPGSDPTNPNEFNWSPLKTLLQNAYSGGATTALYTMNRTPQFALALSGSCSNNPNQPACDKTCNYYVAGKTAASDQPGQCYPPSDLNPDGSGTDQTWKNWVSALAQEAVSLCNAGNAACIKYYEIWNEIDRNNQGYPFPNSSYAAPYLFGSSSPHNTGNSYYGSFAELVRMTQDARCIILGQSSLRSKGSVPYAIDNAGGAGVAESCTQVTGIEPDATIVAPSSHSQAQEGLNVIQDLLYCSVSGTTTGAPNWCNTTNDESYDLDIMNWHMKPANESDGWYAEDEMSTEYCAVVGGCDGQTGILQPNEVDKPFWNGEAGYRGNSAGWTGANGALDITDNPDMQASFIARYALTQWSLGIQSFSWYAYDLDSAIDGSSNGTGAQTGDPALAWSNTYTWLVNQTMTTGGGVPTPCSAASDPSGHTDPNGNPTLWTCSLEGPNSFVGQPIWDIYTAYSCASDSSAGSDCSYYYYTVPSSWHYYRDLWGNETIIPTTGTHAHQVQISNLPIMLENKKLFN